MRLDELSGGRAAGSFSVGNVAMLTQFGRDPGALHVAPRVREAHQAMRAFLDDGRVDFDGRFFSYRGVFLNGTARRAPRTAADRCSPQRRCDTSSTTSAEVPRRSHVTGARSNSDLSKQIRLIGERILPALV